MQFQRVVEGETQDAPANVQKAQFFLGKALYHLHYYQSALAIFDEITQAGAAHLYFNQTLQWLAQLASQLPEPAGIIEKVGRYGVDQLEQFNTQESAELYNQLLYLMGRFKYQQGEFDAGDPALRARRGGLAGYVQAKFFEGITLRAHAPSAARRSVRSARSSRPIDRVATRTASRTRRACSISRGISLARVYYTAANRTERRDGRARGRRPAPRQRGRDVEPHRSAAASTGSTRSSRSAGRSSSRTSTRARSATSTRSSRRTSTTRTTPRRWCSRR